jgi:GxxExxY protein
MNQPLYQELSERLLGLAFKIHNILGPGLLEHCYEEAFCVELNYAGIPSERQKVFALEYRGIDLGGYIADLVVDNKIILELKSVKELSAVMEAQIINYLRLSKIPVGYLLNFNGTRVVWRRFAIKRE